MIVHWIQFWTYFFPQIKKISAHQELRPVVEDIMMKIELNNVPPTFFERLAAMGELYHDPSVLRCAILRRVCHLSPSVFHSVVARLIGAYCLDLHARQFQLLMSGTTSRKEYVCDLLVSITVVDAHILLFLIFCISNSHVKALTDLIGGTTPSELAISVAVYRSTASLLTRACRDGFGVISP
jgi:hypothetical protein